MEAIELKKAVTRNDVAKLAKVSPAIVSYVLNNSNYVSQEKREAVLKVVKELNYVPNQLARGLRTNKSSQIAFVCDNIQTEMFEAVEKSMFEHGYLVSLNYARNTEGFLKMLISKQLEGIFMATNIFDAKQLNSIAANGIPMILYKTKRYDELNTRIVPVAPDYYDAVKKSVDYLVLKGHKSIGLIPPVKYITKGIEGDDFRVRAYVEALEAKGLPIIKSLVCIKTHSVEEICESIFEMLANSQLEARPTALVVGNDYLAAQIIQYLKKLNVFVPEDMAIIGCDNTRFAPVVTPSLTTVDVSPNLLAQASVDKMLALLRGEETEGQYVGVKLVIRESA